MVFFPFFPGLFALVLLKNDSFAPGPVQPASTGGTGHRRAFSVRTSVSRLCMVSCVFARRAHISSKLVCQGQHLLTALSMGDAGQFGCRKISWKIGVSTVLRITIICMFCLGTASCMRGCCHGGGDIFADNVFLMRNPGFSADNVFYKKKPRSPGILIQIILRAYQPAGPATGLSFLMQTGHPPFPRRQKNPPHRETGFWDSDG